MAIRIAVATIHATASDGVAGGPAIRFDLLRRFRMKSGLRRGEDPDGMSCFLFVVGSDLTRSLYELSFGLL